MTPDVPEAVDRVAAVDLVAQLTSARCIRHQSICQTSLIWAWLALLWMPDRFCLDGSDSFTLAKSSLTLEMLAWVRLARPHARRAAREGERDPRFQGLARRFEGWPRPVPQRLQWPGPRPRW